MDKNEDESDFPFNTDYLEENEKFWISEKGLENLKKIYDEDNP